jgi:hypothetical protein
MNKLSFLAYTSWGGLGFFRGTKSYRYQQDKDKTEKYLYLDSFGYGCCGLVLYTNPFLLPFSVYKEIYRLEINVRNLDEKNDFYYQLF